jgi:hypothetical protein
MTFSVVVLSARAGNLIPCVRSVLARDPEISPDRILIVDDGARPEAQTQIPPVRWLSGVKPFVYSRNVNLALRELRGDAILLNDDARLITPCGFTLLAGLVQSRPTLGVCSAGIRGAVCNPRQLASGLCQFRLEPRMLAFICVYLPWSVYQRIGLLDERFTGYGYDDDDYCARVTASGLELGIWDGCEVDHSGELPSTFRTRPDVGVLLEKNRQLFREKWEGRG